MSKSFSSKLGWLVSLSLLAVSSQAFADGNGWAAIVFDPATNSWGSAHGGASRNDAEDNAIGYCGAACSGADSIALEGGQTALHETYVHNGWVAYAHGQGNTHWGTAGDHSSQQNAEYDAYTRCGGAANNCYVVRSLSSYDYQADQSGTNTSGQ
jgi:hypothetical protein